MLFEVLGQAGMGVVYAAYDAELDRKVAIKVLRERLGRSIDVRSRFLRDAAPRELRRAP